MNMWVRVGMSMWMRVGMWHWHTRRTEESATVAPRNWTRTENERDTAALSAADDLLHDTKPSRAPSINAKILPRPRGGFCKDSGEPSHFLVDLDSELRSARGMLAEAANWG